jgi:orotate phosphoribosyltransferase
MSTDMIALMELVSARHGHFRLESGYHSALWLELDTLFSQPHAIAPFVAAMAEKIRPHDASIVCGPLLGGAFLAQLVAQTLDIEFAFTERITPGGVNGMYAARYVLPRVFHARVREKRVAIVDDVMSAGSALRGTFAELEKHGATTAVAGALLVLGTKGVEFFSERAIAVESLGHDKFDLWSPGECPRCAVGEPVEHMSDSRLRDGY